MDRELKELLEIGKAYGFKAPLDPDCDDLTAVSPFKELNADYLDDNKVALGSLVNDPYIKQIFTYDEDNYDLFFPERTDAVLRMAGLGLPN